jgi:hypothetical protein
MFGNMVDAFGHGGWSTPMRWTSYSIMESRLEFVRLVKQGGVSVAGVGRNGRGIAPLREV